MQSSPSYSHSPLQSWTLFFPVTVVILLDWVSETKVLVDGGVYIGFLRPDGGFTIRDVPAGSYVVEAMSPNFMFEPVRVDISGRAKGKSRARKVNFLQNSAVVQVAYPLRFKAKASAPFFEKREKWNIKDMLFNPMVSRCKYGFYVQYPINTLI